MPEVMPFVGIQGETDCGHTDVFRRPASDAGNMDGNERSRHPHLPSFA